MREIRLPLPPFAYKFSLLLEFVRRIAYPARLVVAGDTLWRYVDGQLLVYQQEGGAIVVRGESLPPASHERLKRLSIHGLGLGRDLSAFYAFARREPALWNVVDPLLGMPIFCTETVFEALITLIIEQHITWKNALRYQRTLMRLFDAGAPIGMQRVYRFPSPRRLARATPGELKALKITNRRIDMIRAISRGVVSGALDLESIGGLAPRAAYDRLLTINGVGPWTANNALGRALGVYPDVSHNDVALQAALRRYFHDEEGTKSAALVRDTLGKYGEFAGLAGHFTLLRWVLEQYPPISQ